jgi:hypothetical protein
MSDAARLRSPAAAAPGALLLVVVAMLGPLSAAQGSSIPNDFSITLERIGCLGSCPDHKVTILADGSVEYDGRAYVRIEGKREKTIPVAAVAKLVKELQDDDFVDWEENNEVCIDFPEVRITVTLNKQRKQVLEGCKHARENSQARTRYR